MTLITEDQLAEWARTSERGEYLYPNQALALIAAYRAMAGRIVVLEKSVDDLFKAGDAALCSSVAKTTEFEQCESALATANTRIAALTEALRPFDKLTEALELIHNKGIVGDDFVISIPTSIGRLKAARAALAHPHPAQGEKADG